MNWIELRQSPSGWEKYSTKTLRVKGSVYYSSLDPKCQGIVLSAKKLFKFTHDSENPIVEVEEPVKSEELNGQSEESVCNFTWTQNEEDITINFKEILDAEKQDYQVKCENKRLEVSCRTETLVASDIFEEIDVNLTTWSLQNNQLQVNLIKMNSDLIWPYLIPGGPLEDHEDRQGQQFFDAAAVSNNIELQMEDCDVAEDEYFISEFCCKMYDTIVSNFQSTFRSL